MVFNLVMPEASEVTDIQHWFQYSPSLEYLNDILIFFSDWGRTSMLVTDWIVQDAFFISQSRHYHLFPLNLWNSPGGFGEHHWPDIGGWQGIGETEGPYWPIFVVANGSVGHNLPLILLSDLNKMIGIAKVEFADDAGPLQKLKHHWDEWWVVVVAWCLSGLGSWYKAERFCPFSLQRTNPPQPGRMNDPYCQCGLDVFADNFFLKQTSLKGEVCSLTQLSRCSSWAWAWRSFVRGRS